ncbi:kelch repeat protein [Tritrichomonas foetus]|uniref:Kelch repeat protein n=1 Tax=Tritrichomonas foetus TaxID=1144522 RepID=A0A1J4JTW2_9EUKA|nr:kelch repeat protein [Tritrichomonas foetus]|eukprot:OHT02567.1 kelch repeat protein [Tritrichomonas foetus]
MDKKITSYHSFYRMGQEQSTAGRKRSNSYATVGLMQQALIKEAIDNFHGTKSNAICSIINPTGSIPLKRESHFACYDYKNHTLYAGYGLGLGNTQYNNVYYINTQDIVWKQLNLTGNPVSPRYGANAAFDGREFIYVFGGYEINSKQYFSDFHRINVKTGRVDAIEYLPTPNAPDARISPFIGHYNNKVFIWGGFNIESGPSTYLHIYDIAERYWRRIDTHHTGNPRSSFTIFDKYMIIYAPQDEQAFAVIDMDAEKFTYIDCNTPNAPAFDLFKPGVCFDGEYIYVIGGRSRVNYSRVHAFSMQNRYWSVLNVEPDDVAFSRRSGVKNEHGEFYLPSVDSFTAVCDGDRIMGFLGNIVEKLVFVLKVDKNILKAI